MLTHSCSRTPARLRRGQRGQGLIEYAIILALIALLVIAIMNVLGKNVQSSLCQASTGLTGQSASGCTIWGSGSNFYGELGLGWTGNGGATPQQSSGGPVGPIMATASGTFMTVALKYDGTVWTWGANGFGELGNGASCGATYPSECLGSNVPVQVSGLSSVVAVGATAITGYAVKSDGSVWSWGGNAYGELGNDTQSVCGAGLPTVPNCQGSTSPVQVCAVGVVVANCGGSYLSGVKAISSGGAYSVLALKSDGTIVAWGSGGAGQLGNGLGTNSLVPVNVTMSGSFTSATAVAAGSYFGMAIATGGNVFTWGDDGENELGTGEAVCSPDPCDKHSAPVQVSTISNITAISGGRLHAMALSSSGTLYGWGDNFYGELGTAPCTPQPCGASTPTTIPGVSQVVAISAGSYYSLVATSGGQAWGCGRDDWGQLGNGSINSVSPYNVDPMTQVLKVKNVVLVQATWLSSEFITRGLNGQ